MAHILVWRHHCLPAHVHKQDTQDLVQRLLADTFMERPCNVLRYMIMWLQAEETRRNERNGMGGSTTQMRVCTETTEKQHLQKT